MGRELSEIKKELLAAAEKSGLQNIVKMLAAIVKTIEPEKRKDVIKYLPLLLAIGEKPLDSEKYTILYNKGLINRPKKGDKCPICLKGSVKMHSTGRGGWESSCSRCGFLYDED